MKRLFSGFLFLWAAAYALSITPDLQWQRSYGTPNDDYCYGMIAETDGDIVLYGSTEGFGQSADGYILRVDPDGVVVDSTHWGGVNTDWFRSGIESTVSPGTLIFVGGTNAASFSEWGDAVLVRFDESLQPIESQVYPEGSGAHAVGVTENTDGSIVLTGNESTSSDAAGVFMLCTDSANGLVWQRLLLDYATSWTTAAPYVMAADDGYYVIAYGYSGSYLRTRLLHTDTEGNVLWNQLLIFDSYFTVRCTDFALTRDGNLLLVGEAYPSSGEDGQVFATKLDCNGSILWGRSYGGAGEDYAAQVTAIPQGGFLVSGTTESYGDAEGDSFLLRLSETGDSLWSVILGGNGRDYGRKAVVAADGSIYTCGTTESGSCGSEDFYLAKFTADSLAAGDQITSGKAILTLSNSPNPFNPETRISYSVPKTEAVEVSVYNLRGQLVKTLFRGTGEAGEHTVRWSGTDCANRACASGVYFCKVKAGTEVKVHKMMLMK